jgi:diguanylate cyclase (GGDEF)-like protein
VAITADIYHQPTKKTARRPPGDRLFLDVDGLKEVNDSFGHSEGDRILTLVAEERDTLRSARVRAR